MQGFTPALPRSEVDVLEGLTTAIIVAEQRMAADTCSAKWEQIVDRMEAQQ